MCKYFILLLFLIRIDFAHAENINIDGTRPFVSLTHAINDRWGVNFFDSETINLVAANEGSFSYPARDMQSYTQLTAYYLLSANWNLTFGYVFQKSNPFSNNFTNENRFFQQVTYSHGLGLGRLAHRLRFEERYIQARGAAVDPMATRLRYQIGYTQALKGNVIVANSWFYNIYNEFYFSTSGKRNSLYSENWTYAGLGYQSYSMGTFSFGPLLQVATINSAKATRSFLLAQLGWSANF
jgi:hypothetical protein